MTGCTTVSTQESAPGKPAGIDTLSVSVEEEIGLYRQAITALNNSQLDYAETELKKIAKKRPEFSGPWINLALIDIRRKNMENAEKNLVKALERNPKMSQAFNALGFIELSRSNYIKAADNYRKAFTIKDDYAIAHYNYALLHDIYLQDIQVATRHYRRYLALTKNPDKITEDWVLELERELAKGAK